MQGWLLPVPGAQGLCVLSIKWDPIRKKGDRRRPWKMEKIPHSWVGRNNLVKTATPAIPHLLFRLNAILIRIPTAFRTELRKQS